MSLFSRVSVNSARSSSLARSLSGQTGHWAPIRHSLSSLIKSPQLAGPLACVASDFEFLLLQIATSVLGIASFLSFHAEFTFPSITNKPTPSPFERSPSTQRHSQSHTPTLPLSQSHSHKPNTKQEQELRKKRISW